MYKATLSVVLSLLFANTYAIKASSNLALAAYANEAATLRSLLENHFPRNLNLNSDFDDGEDELDESQEFPPYYPDWGVDSDEEADTDDEFDEDSYPGFRAPIWAEVDAEDEMTAEQKKGSGSATAAVKGAASKVASGVKSAGRSASAGISSAGRSASAGIKSAGKAVSGAASKAANSKAGQIAKTGATHFANDFASNVKDRAVDGSLFTAPHAALAHSAVKAGITATSKTIAQHSTGKTSKAATMAGNIGSTAMDIKGVGSD